MIRTLYPGAEGPKVSRAKALLHDNKYGRFIGGKHLGPSFGPAMGMAVREAKWFLGYEQADCHSMAYGQKLHDYLAGATPLSAKMHYRRAKRRAAEVLLAKRRKAVVIAARQVGYIERPGNRNKFGKWYGMDGVAWCAEFVSWCYDQAGLDFHYAYVPFAVSDAHNHKNGLSWVAFSSGKAGDAVAFDWDNDGVADHIGILTGKRASTALTIEGNTSPSDFSNGGMVMRRERPFSDTAGGFIRVGKAKS